MANPKRDAIGLQQCGTCRYWHNPQGLAMGLCIAHPPAPLVVGMQPVEPPVIARTDKPQQQMAMPVVLGYFPSTYAYQGCAHHQHEIEAN